MIYIHNFMSINLLYQKCIKIFYKKTSPNYDHVIIGKPCHMLREKYVILYYYKTIW